LLCDSTHTPQVHTFDPTVNAKVMAARSAAGKYKFHLQGLGSAAQSKHGQVLKGGPLKTLQETMQQLKHTGRTIDILKIDCEVHHTVHVVLDACMLSAW
jgi:Methyltransferase domain